MSVEVTSFSFLFLLLLLLLWFLLLLLLVFILTSHSSCNLFLLLLLLFFVMVIVVIFVFIFVLVLFFVLFFVFFLLLLLLFFFLIFLLYLLLHKISMGVLFYWQTLWMFYHRKKSADPTYYTSQGILTGGVHMHSAAKGRATPTGLESACTVIIILLSCYYNALWQLISMNKVLGSL